MIDSMGCSVVRVGKLWIIFRRFINVKYCLPALLFYNGLITLLNHYKRGIKPLWNYTPL